MHQQRAAGRDTQRAKLVNDFNLGDFARAHSDARFARA
jgi:hypothetical protein